MDLYRSLVVLLLAVVIAGNCQFFDESEYNGQFAPDCNAEVVKSDDDHKSDSDLLDSRKDEMGQNSIERKKRHMIDPVDQERSRKELREERARMRWNPNVRRDQEEYVERLDTVEEGPNAGATGRTRTRNGPRRNGDRNNVHP